MRNEAIDDLGIEQCIGCGKCTFSCLASHRYDFSPRLVAEKTLARSLPAKDLAIWACTTCGACTDACPHGVDFKEYIRKLRLKNGNDFPLVHTHNGVLDGLRSINANSRLKPDTLVWLTPDLRTDDSSTTLLFTGCTPYFDVVFRSFRKDILDIPRSAVRLLNATGTMPRLLPNERCCGHDSYWMGDEKTFDRLAELNVEAIEKTGVSEVITFCPECYTALHDLYPRRLGKLGFKVRILSDALAESITQKKIEFQKTEEDLTFQDPCRLSKHSGIVSSPREIIQSLGTLKDMPRSGKNSACCGTACWVNCDSTAKAWQMERLKEASETGSRTLLTACPKCLIHLSCADDHHGNELTKRVNITDLYVLAARSIKR